MVAEPLPLILKSESCPCDCGGNGVLVFLACPNCEAVILACDEIGNAFDNLDNPLVSNPLVLWREARQYCPACSAAMLADFRLATENDLERCSVSGDRIASAGLAVAQSIRRVQE